MQNTFPQVGSFVLVVGRPCEFRTCAGLFGYVEHVWGEKESKQEGGAIGINLLRYPTLEGWNSESEKRGEKSGRFSDYYVTAKLTDVVELTDPKAIARVAEYQKAKQKEREEQKEDEKLQAIIKDICDSKDEHSDRNLAVQRETERIGSVFSLPGYIKRGNKSNYPAFRSAEVQKIVNERNGYAYCGKKYSEFSLTELARWRQANEMIDRASFWIDDADVRALVRELDLDPFADNFNSALYIDKGWVFASRKDLRREAIRLWNKGAIITQIHGGENADTNWSEDKGPVAPGFLIHYSIKRKLPVPA